MSVFKDVNRKQTALYGLISVLIVAALAAATFRPRVSRCEKQYFQVVTLGDSVLGLVRDDSGIPALLGEKLGKTVFNGAFGGTCVGRMGGEGEKAYAMDALSLSGIAKAIASRDFGVQQAGKIRDGVTEYFGSVVDGLESIDFSATEIVVIMHGLNDIYAGVPLGNGDKTTDEFTFEGALRKSVENLKRINPDMRILLVTPTFTWFLPTGQTSDEYDKGYGTAQDYVAAEIKVANDMGVEILDLYHDFYPHEKWEDFLLYTEDGLHPNEAGRELIADAIYEYLSENP